MFDLENGKMSLAIFEETLKIQVYYYSVGDLPWDQRGTSGNHDIIQ